ncbi:dipeptide ABC transporter ATP-binding protein [Aromatoleum petrolei]|uniref:Dipeptide ABC transporter ATP-binding protein n=1 Tax=Aromatoleum petrolei TaxID=76116 RepID=A0ABX1MQA1_9RHOO|nr:dipeptide ABC transporter ATP-binding protein [Aromatoleum petrolei]NMF90127.1 dipeptide ABC transporter ATP-binding protein [Aromatoleum petrolei]QTQ34247.1 putative oligopeptide/dipeptide ABC transporter, ATP-binding protein [Aromatoleum petrolei]
MTVLAGTDRPPAQEDRPIDAPLLDVRHLRVHIGAAARPVRPVDGVGFSIAAGETFALLGESGCGKSMTALALLRLLPDAGRIVGGEVRFAGDELLARSEADMREVRGGRIAMIFQEPSTSLNPVMTVMTQIGEVLARHRGLRGAAARAEAQRLLDAVGIPDAARRLDDYPFQFSGGMKQRVMIAMALAGDPELLIADEPTTALDVTIQAQVLDLLARLQAERGMGMLLITHDLGVVAHMAHRIGVMYAGELVETGARDDFFRAPLHPYSRKLFAALPTDAQRGHPLAALGGHVPPLDQVFTGCRFAGRCPDVFERCHHDAPAWQSVGAQAVRCHLYAEDHAERPAVSAAAASAGAAGERAATRTAPLLDVRDLQVHFPVRKGLLRREVARVRAVDGVSLALAPGRTLALVGESGCGKTTAGKAILQLVAPTGGEVYLDGTPLAGLSRAALRALRRDFQMVFQDPFASLNPRMRVGEIIEEGMLALGVEKDPSARAEQIDALLARVGLTSEMRLRYPHEFSGGQRQRIAIARALAVRPKLIVCDEPTSALDVSVQAQILNLMRELQAEFDLAYLFITHNIGVVSWLADDVAVMYLGRIVEQGPVGKVLAAPAHPYTRALLAAVPDIARETAAHAGAAERATRPVVAGDLPSPLAPPPGCHFHPRCERATDICRAQYPAVTDLRGGRSVRCHWPA